MGSGCLHGALGLLDEPSALTRSFHQLTLACCARGPGDGGEPAWGQHGSAEPYGPGRAADPMTFPRKFVWKLHGAPRAWRPLQAWGALADVVGVGGVQLQPPRGLASTPSSHNARGPTARPQRGATSCQGRLAVLIIANMDCFGCI